MLLSTSPSDFQNRRETSVTCYLTYPQWKNEIYQLGTVETTRTSDINYTAAKAGKIQPRLKD